MMITVNTGHYENQSNVCLVYYHTFFPDLTSEDETLRTNFAEICSGLCEKLKNAFLETVAKENEEAKEIADIINRNARMDMSMYPPKNIPYRVKLHTPETYLEKIWKGTSEDNTLLWETTENAGLYSHPHHSGEPIRLVLHIYNFLEYLTDEEDEPTFELVYLNATV